MADEQYNLNGERQVNRRKTWQSGYSVNTEINISEEALAYHDESNESNEFTSQAQNITDSDISKDEGVKNSNKGKGETASPKMEEYFSSLKESITRAYDIAGQARKKSLDPEDFVEIAMVENMAERCEGLISVVCPQIRNNGVSQRILQLEEEFGSLNWRVALTIGLEVAKQKYCKFKTEEEAIDIGIRMGFAYLTMGIVASPLEGFVEFKIVPRRDGKGKFFALSYAGPIRSAGGTGASVSVLLADYIRKNMGYAEYDPTEEEAKRYVTELHDYHERITNLQYLPSEEEIYFLGKHLPVQIIGDGSEQIEVSNYKDLDRVSTNRIRNGVCLCMGEGLAQKAEKLVKQLSKWGHDFGLEHWDWIKEFVDLKKKMHAKGDAGKEKTDGDNKPKLLPDYTFIKDLVGGRPIFTHPMRPGGFRLRYGRSRTSGYSSYSIHPSTMFVMEDYLAIGTQLKNERPGKGCTVTPCDSIEGPIVKLRNGDVIRLNDVELAKKVARKVETVLFMGDILINYGDFNDRGHMLAPPGYSEEWWKLELEKYAREKLNLENDSDIDTSKLADYIGIEVERLERFMGNYLFEKPTGYEAEIISKKLGVPLHPRFSYHWKCVENDKIEIVAKAIKKASLEKETINGIEVVSKIVIPYTGPKLDYDVVTIEGARKTPEQIEEEKKVDHVKTTLELVGVPHKLSTDFIVIEGGHAYTLYNLFKDDISVDNSKDSQENIESFSSSRNSIKLRDKSGVFIGARMGRPEKSKMRKLQGSPHVLFPVGEEGGRMKSFQAALDAGKVTENFPLFYCVQCEKKTLYRVCEECGEKSIPLYHCNTCGFSDKAVCDHGDKRSTRKEEIDIRAYFNAAMKHLGIQNSPELIKGPKGTANKSHEVENIAKGILRAKHNVFVNKDGTTRYDMTQLPITHFKPKEIYTSIETLKKFGYDVDIYGKPLENEEQVLELKPQDIVLPRNVNTPEEGAQIVLKRIADFIDELLVKFYGMDAYYNIKTQEDLVGHMCLVLAPHTSGGIAGRIIGFSDTQGLFANPMLHAGTRRDCDGDEACVCLLLDVLLNFSRHYLPAHRGSTQDAPLVLTWKLTPAEVDDMVFNMDIPWKYDLSFYDACLEYKKPWDVKVDIVDNFLGKPKQYEGWGFTHPTSNFNNGVLCSAYKTLPSMKDKLDGQMSLGVKIRAVDEGDVARLVIEKHFLKDIKGNLRKFSMQQFRCVNCNTKYRRPPLSGRCTACNRGKIIFTISHGSIIKYLTPSIELGTKYPIPKYLSQTLEILKRRVEGVFGKEAEKQSGLGEFF